MRKIINYAIQCLWIGIFYISGIGISRLIGGVVPGSVLGMLLLFAALSSGVLKERQVADVSHFLLKYMVLFFLPAAVGTMVVWSLISDNIVAIAVASVVSTVLIISLVGIVQQKMGHHGK